MKSKIIGLTLFSASMFVCAQSAQVGTNSSLPEESSTKKTLKSNPDINNKVQKAQMRFIGTFESGYKDAGIYKMVDPSDGVICYVLMPDNSSNRMVDGKLIYEANNVGSISCVKGR